MSDKYSYDSFNDDESDSEIEKIRRQVIRQEIVRHIRKTERDNIAMMIAEREAGPPTPFVFPRFLRYLFVFFAFLGLLVIAAYLIGMPL